MECSASIFFSRKFILFLQNKLKKDFKTVKLKLQLPNLEMRQAMCLQMKFTVRNLTT